jgi:hypothetical protein
MGVSSADEFYAEGYSIGFGAGYGKALEEAAKVAREWEPKDLGEAESGWEARKKIADAILHLRTPTTFIAEKHNTTEK